MDRRNHHETTDQVHAKKNSGDMIEIKSSQVASVERIQKYIKNEDSGDTKWFCI
jgi:TusA-related sulfurtransferase